MLAEDAKVTIKVAPGATLTMGQSRGHERRVCIETWHGVQLGSNVLMAPHAFVIDDDTHGLEPG